MIDLGRYLFSIAVVVDTHLNEVAALESPALIVFES